MSTAESAGNRARAARAAADWHTRKAERAARVADALEKGERGELAAAVLLAPLNNHGFHRLDDRAVPDSDANVDHLLAGPPGVIIVDAKNWSGSLTIADRAVRHNGRSRRQMIEGMRALAVVVADLLHEAFPEMRVPVWPVAAFVGEARPAVRSVVERVHILDGEDVEAWALAQPAVLQPAAIERVLAHLDTHLPPRTLASATATTPADVAPPEDLVVFLEEWRRYGRHRLYVKDADGNEAGYLDLASGKVVTSSDAWTALLMQLLPHYLQGDTPGLGRGDLSEESRGAIRRFLDSLLNRAPERHERTIVACYHWRNYGKNRLYLHRLTPKGGKAELGWFDLDGGRLSAKGDTARILGYCGNRYLAVSDRPGVSSARSRGTRTAPEPGAER